MAAPSEHREDPSTEAETMRMPSLEIADASDALAQSGPVLREPSDTEPDPPDPDTLGPNLETVPRSRMRVTADDVRNAVRKLNARAVALASRLRPGRSLSEGDTDAGTKADTRSPWIVSRMVGAGALVTLGVAIAALGLGRHRNEAAPPMTAGASSQVPAVVVPPSTARKPVAPIESSPVTTKACTLSGTERVLAPSVMLVAGVEARVLGSTGDLAVGWAGTERDALALRLASTTLAVSAKAKIRTLNGIRRVTPTLSAKGELEVVADVDDKRDEIVGRRTLPVDPPMQVGASGDDLVWMARGAAPDGKLWPLGGANEVQALRGAVDDGRDGGPIAIAFRQNGTIRVGLANGRGPLAPSGDLFRIEGLGGGLGSPAVAVNDGVVVIVWADRTSVDAPWGLRWVHFRVGQTPGSPEAFALPPDGPGGEAMSPAVVAVRGNRFLLVWTEGSVSRRHVRAVTLSENGSTIGPGVDISNAEVNAGQACAAVAPDGSGLIAFLEAGDHGFRVAATPVACGM